MKAPLPADLPDNNSGIDVARLPDSALALACNLVGENWGPCTPLSLMLSFDNGETWSGRLFRGDGQTTHNGGSFSQTLPRCRATKR